MHYKYFSQKCEKKHNVRKYASVISISKSWPNNTCNQLNKEPCVIEDKAITDLCRENPHLFCNSRAKDVNCNENPKDNLKTSMLKGIRVKLFSKLPIFNCVNL